MTVTCKIKTDQGIEPGSSGSMTFYIISHKDGPLSVKLNLTLTGYQVEGWDPSAATKKGADDTSTVTVKSIKGSRFNCPTAIRRSCAAICRMR